MSPETAAEAIPAKARREAPAIIIVKSFLIFMLFSFGDYVGFVIKYVR
jgi:hypothetical protein